MKRFRILSFFLFALVFAGGGMFGMVGNVLGASCYFDPSAITSSMHGAERKTTLHCNSGFHIVCSSSAKGEILSNTKCDGIGAPSVTVSDNSKDTTITCTTTNDSTSAKETCSILFSAESSSTTCNASYCQASACSSSQTENTSCGGQVCSTGQHYCAPNSSTTTPGSGSSTTISFPNPLKYNTVQEVLTALLHALQGVIVVLSLVFIVIGAVLYIISAGNQGRMTMAKGAILAALIGLAIGILAPTFLKEVAVALGWGSTDIPSEVSAAPTAAAILINVLNFLLGIVGVLSIIMLVIGGGMYLTAAGSPGQIDSAKSVVKYAIIGVIIALASLVLVRQLAYFFATA